MPHVRRQEKDFTLADRDVIKIAVIADLEHHVAFELIEELLDRIIVVVAALVGAAHHLDGHGSVLEHFFIADRRLEKVSIVLYPFLEAEGVQSSCSHGDHLQTARGLISPVGDPASTRRSPTPVAWFPFARNEVQHRRAHASTRLAEQFPPSRVLAPGDLLYSSKIG